MRFIKATGYQMYFKLKKDLELTDNKTEIKNKITF